MEHLLTYGEAAEVLGMHKETVAVLVRAGKIKHIQTTKRSVRIDPEDLREYIKSSRKDGSAGERTLEQLKADNKKGKD